MEVPALKDCIQQVTGNNQIPEIRVWCHPHRIDKDGDDYYEIFDTFENALKFIDEHKEAEEVPLIAFRGYEFNLWEVEESKHKQGKTIN